MLTILRHLAMKKVEINVGTRGIMDLRNFLNHGIPLNVCHLLMDLFCHIYN